MIKFPIYLNFFSSDLKDHMYLVNVGVWENKVTWERGGLFEHGNGYEYYRYARKYDTNLIFNL